MGVLTRGILGGFSNKVGPVVGSSWKGIDVIRSMPLSVANPNTPAQQAQRGRFSVITEFASTLLGSVVKPLWDRNAKQMSGYNAFIQENIKAVKPDLTIDPSLVVISKGTIGITITNVAIDAVEETATITWDNTDVPFNSKPTDILYAVVMEDNNNFVAALQTTVMRSAGTATFSIKGIPQTGMIWSITAFKAADGLTQSDSFASEY